MTNENDAVRDKDKQAETIPLLFDKFAAGKEIADELIPKFHPDLASARFIFICRNKAVKRGGTPVPGNVYKMSGKFEFLLDADFIVEVALDVWNPMEPSQRRALVDHLLAQCIGEEDEENGSFKWRKVPPAVQEFPEVAARNGQWNDGLIDLQKSLR